MKEGFYVLNFDKVREVFNDYVESIEERMIETEINETQELIDGKLIVTKREVKKQMISNETKLKLNQLLTHCLELILVSKDDIIEPEGDIIKSIDDDENYSDEYLLAFRTLTFYKILERKN